MEFSNEPKDIEASFRRMGCCTGIGKFMLKVSASIIFVLLIYASWDLLSVWVRSRSWPSVEGKVVRRSIGSV